MFEDIAHHCLNKQSLDGTITVKDEPASKKRKLNGALPINSTQQNLPREVVLEARDLSFSLPQRKKYHFGIAQYGSDIHSPSTTFSFFIRTRATNEVELEIPVSQFAYAVRLPVPEKTTKQYNFCLLPKSSPQEPLIFTVPHGPLKTLDIPSSPLSAIAQKQEESSDVGILENALQFILGRSDTSLTLPNADEFASATPEPHRRNDKAYHVKAFRGSKDGFLFFLENGIFFGFKKPLTFFAFEDIESVSYTSVLQRTFNLNISYRAPNSGTDDGDEADIHEIEFSMLDQADFPGIDAYLKRHSLQDASLAESRRAKKVNVNGNANRAAQPKSGDENGADEDSRTELEKAQEQLEDEEDEEEEDYDPGSDGESEGSGNDSSDDEEDEEDEPVKKRAKGKNLVADELGSEAEDVSVTEEEEEEGQGEGDEQDAEMQEEEEEDYDEEEEEEEEEVQEDVKPAVSGFASVAMTSVQQGRWGHQNAAPNPEDDDQL